MFSIPTIPTSDKHRAIRSWLNFYGYEVEHVFKLPKNGGQVAGWAAGLPRVIVTNAEAKAHRRPQPQRQRKARAS